MISYKEIKIPPHFRNALRRAKGYGANEKAKAQIRHYIYDRYNINILKIKPNIERVKECLIDEKCYYCGNGGELNKDHYIPRALGGGGKDNIVPSCLDCNSIKADLLPIAKGTPDAED